MNTDSCDMRRADLRHSWEMESGEFRFTLREGQRFFECALPNGVGLMVPIRPADPALNGGHSWEWDGNEDKPTLNPSINAVGSWHGWIKAGRMVSC